MKVTYFRTTMPIWKILKHREKMRKHSFQVTLSSVLEKALEDDLKIYNACEKISETTGLNFDSLLEKALLADFARDLASTLPQINTKMSKIKALEDIANQPLDRLWLALDIKDVPIGIHTRHPGEGTRTIELPILRQKEDVEDTTD